MNQKGFTLIELVVVIVVLGILAAIAVPKYVDMTAEARQSSVDGIAGALASASAINYAADLAKGAVYGASLASATGKSGVEDTSVGCTEGLALLLVPDGDFQNTGATSGYDISGATTITNIGDSIDCTVTSNEDSTKTATFSLLGAK